MEQSQDLSLRRAFSTPKLEGVLKLVWDALRGQACRDLLGYYDYKRSFNKRAEQLSLVVTSGNYRPRASLPISISKSDLLARHMHIPHPEDAVVLQAISEALLPPIKKSAPSENAYFARSHNEHAGLHTQDQIRVYPWFRLWPRYQTKILKFAEAKNLLVVTDVQNFFDSVRFNVIRRKMSEISGSLPLVDLMLLLFENFIRRDMYAPITLVGIPTINVDAPRLVGHALLFDVDEYLAKHTGNNFARWLDDVNFGVDNVRDARERIRAIDAILRKIGLRLGGGKTKILSYEQARHYLQADENQRLNVVETNAKPPRPLQPAQARKVLLGFLRFHKEEPYGYWDKVMRRYYRLVARANREILKKSAAYMTLLRKIEACARKDFIELTATEYRETIINFWKTLRPTDTRIKYYIEAFRQVQGYDDATAFSLAELLTDLSLSTIQASAVAKMMMGLLGTANSPGFYFGVTWFLAKHGNQKNIVEFISKTTALWESNYFFARQAVALWSMIPAESSPAIRLRDAFLSKHDPNIAALVNFIDMLRATAMPDASLRGYLPLNEHLKNFDLRRAIISSNVMRSPNLDSAKRAANEARIEAIVKDPALKRIALGGTAR